MCFNENKLFMCLNVASRQFHTNLLGKSFFFCLLYRFQPVQYATTYGLLWSTTFLVSFFPVSLSLSIYLSLSNSQIFSLLHSLNLSHSLFLPDFLYFQYGTPYRLRTPEELMGQYPERGSGRLWLVFHRTRIWIQCSINQIISSLDPEPALDI